MKIQVDRVIYHGLSKHELGGWDYTRETLGTFETENELSLDEAELEARIRFPEATCFMAWPKQEDGTYHQQWEFFGSF